MVLNRRGIFSLLAIKKSLKEENVYLRHYGNDSFEVYILFHYTYCNVLTVLPSEKSLLTLPEKDARKRQKFHQRQILNAMWTSCHVNVKTLFFFLKNSYPMKKDFHAHLSLGLFCEPMIVILLQKQKISFLAIRSGSSLISNWII